MRFIFKGYMKKLLVAVVLCLVSLTSSTAETLNDDRTNKALKNLRGQWVGQLVLSKYFNSETHCGSTSCATDLLLDLNSTSTLGVSQSNDRNEPEKWSAGITAVFGNQLCQAKNRNLIFCQQQAGLVTIQGEDFRLYEEIRIKRTAKRSLDLTINYFVRNQDGGEVSAVQSFRGTFSK